jgi:hypothetical protein
METAVTCRNKLRKAEVGLEHQTWHSQTEELHRQDVLSRRALGNAMSWLTGKVLLWPDLGRLDGPYLEHH